MYSLQHIIFFSKQVSSSANPRVLFLPFYHFIFIYLLINFQLIAQTPQENFTVVDEMEFETHVMNGADFPNAVSSYNGAIYYTYIDPDLKGKVVKKDVDGTITETVIIESVDFNEHHTELSMAVDKDGYIHFVGNMHGTSMNYWRSSQPEQITNWTFLGNDTAVGGIEGESVTYPRFVKNRKGTLFICFRAAVINPDDNGGRAPGWMGGAIARYDTETQKWTRLGSTNYSFMNNNGAAVYGNGIDEWNEKLVVWDSSGIATASQRAYQAYKLRVVFDKNDRMHMAWNVGRNKATASPSSVSQEMTHIFYAYSDDEGETWQKMDGSRVHLPMTSENAEIVFQDETYRMGNFIELILDDKGNPVIMQPAFFQGTDGDTDFIVLVFQWDGSKWSKVNYTENDGWVKSMGYPIRWPGTGCTDFHGVMTLFDPDHQRIINRSWDGGKTWQPHVLDEEYFYLTRVVSVDYDYLYETGDIRFQAQSDPDLGAPYRVKVLTIDFDGNDNLLPPEPETITPDPIPQSITFDPIPDGSFQTYNLQARASSTLPVKYTVISGPASIVNESRLVPTELGEITIQAQQPGNDLFLPAEPVSQTFTINTKGTQIITFENIGEKEYGDPPFEVNVNSNTNLPISLSIIEGKASIENNLLTIEGAGIITIEAKVDETENYFETVSQKSFAVGKASQTINFLKIDDISPTSKEDLYVPLRATATSGLPITFEVISGPAALENDTLILSGNTGEIIVRAIQQGDDNYDPAPIVGQIIEVKNRFILQSSFVENPLVRVFPNPADESLFIEINNFSNDSFIQIFDITGSVVFSKMLFDRTEEIDVSLYDEGIYFINVSSNTHNLTHKFLIR